MGLTVKRTEFEVLFQSVKALPLGVSRGLIKSPRVATKYSFKDYVIMMVWQTWFVGRTFASTPCACFSNNNVGSIPLIE